MTTVIHRPHVLGIDDGPFDKRSDRSVSVVGVMTEGADLVEAVAVTRFAVDGDDATGFVAGWIEGLRFASALHGVVFGGITIAGLGILDIVELSERLGVPVVVVNRQRPANEPLIGALRAAGLDDRIAIVERSPESWRVNDGLFASHTGAGRESVERMLEATINKSQLPEPLRLAHLIGGAIGHGQSRGRP